MKIAEGCDHPCTFCVIPQYRGKFRSRRFESVIAEATRLFQQGVREINLIGQDTTCYGEDLGLKDGLAALLARLAQIETPAEKWIRFLYAYPNKVTQKLLDTIAEHAALVKYIDMPLQHASARVLEAHEARRVGRHLPQADRAHPRAPFPAWPSAPASSSAFPARPTPISKSSASSSKPRSFDRLGVFSYSDEDSSASYRLDGKVDAPHDPQPQAPPDGDAAQDCPRTNRQLIGSEVDVLVEGLSTETDLLWEARMPTQAPEIDGVTLINDFEGAEPKPGQMRQLRITEAHDYDVVGTLLPGPTEMVPVAMPFPLLQIQPNPKPQIPNPAL